MSKINPTKPKKIALATNSGLIKDRKQDQSKPHKAKMQRDSFTMPREEYAQIAILKTRLFALGQATKKSELLRAGIMLLAAMSYNILKTTLAAVPVIKTGRPSKH